MKEKQRIALLVMILAVVSLTVAGISTVMLYRAALSSARAVLQR